MAQAAYPTFIDLGAWLQDAGLTAEAVANLDLHSAIAAGIAEFESRTGRRMIATTQTREFDVPGNRRGMLDLRGDVVSVSGVTIRGASLAATEWRLLPLNASDEGKPFFLLQMNQRFYPPLRAPDWGIIAVTGLWGYGTTIPDDAWQAMLAAAGLALFPYLAHEQSAGLEMFSEADVTERYGADPLGSLRKNWRTALLGPDGPGGVDGMGGAAGRYRRVTIGASG